MTKKHTFSKPKMPRFKHNKTPGSRSAVLPDMNISEIARQAEMNRTHLSRILNGGQGCVSMRNLVKLKVALKMKSVEQVEQWLEGLKAARLGRGQSVPLKGKQEASK